MDKKISEIIEELEKLTGEIQQQLQELSYPFAHARGSLTVAEYARNEKLPEEKWDCAYANAHTHLDRLFALHYRLVGKVLAHADAAEKAVSAN